MPDIAIGNYDASATMPNNDNLYKLVDDFCTTEQIKQLLRAGKERDSLDVRITAENKSELINRNLRGAVEAGAVLLQDVHDLIRSAEENGRQHIQFYKIPKKLATALTMDHVGALLWGKNWKAHFPNFDLKENDFVFGDFRQWNPGKKPLDWTIKIYGNELHERFTGKIEERGGYLYKEFVREELRIILMARFNSPDLLEIRIQSDTSRRRMDLWEVKIWSMLQRVISRTQLSSWDMTKICAKLMESVEAFSGLYQLGDTRLRGSEGQRISFEPHAPAANLFAAEEMKGAVSGLMSANSECTDLRVTWRGFEGKPLERDLTVLLGGNTGNQMIVSSASNARGIDYVTQQLRFFSH